MTAVEEETQQYLGMSMTYSLFEFIKEKFDELMSDQPEEEEILEVTEKTTSLEIEQVSPFV